MTERPKRGKRAGVGSGSAAKRTVDAIEKKYGVAARKAAQRGGRKPAVWTGAGATKGRGGRVMNPLRTNALPHDARVSDNLSIAVVCSLEASASEVFRAFNDPSRRSWSMERDYVVRTTIAPRLLRIGMPDDTLVAVTIARRGNARCTVTVEQGKLPDEQAAEQARARWREALARLSDLLAE